MNFIFKRGCHQNEELSSISEFPRKVIFKEQIMKLYARLIDFKLNFILILILKCLLLLFN